MKILVGNEQGSYSFDPATKTIILSGLDDLRLEQLLLITNVSTNTFIYNFAKPTLGATITNNIITLDCDTTAMSPDDALQIFVDVPDVNSEMLRLLRRQIKLLEPIGNVDINNRQKVAVEAMPTTTVTIATTGGANVTGIGYPVTANTAGGNPYTLTSQPTQMVATIIDQRIVEQNAMRNTYDCIRNKLSWT